MFKLSKCLNQTYAFSLPLIKLNTAAALVLSVGCKRGPITIAAFIETNCISFSFANFHAAFSANVLDSTYHSFYKSKHSVFQPKKNRVIAW